MIYALRLLHILSGAFWFGALIFSVRLLMPSLQALGPAMVGWNVATVSPRTALAWRHPRNHQVALPEFS